MSLLVSWDQVADYVTQLKGYDYLTNPSTWMECFREVVSDARYVGIEDGTGTFLFNTAVDWLSVGKSAPTALDGGNISLPAVKNVVTNTATGGAAVADAALATEAVGTTITLTGAGVAAAVLVSLGIGVTAYQTSETVREFYHGLFSAIAGEELPAEYFEPITLEEVKALLTVEDVTPQQPVGNIYTYLPTEWLSRAYDYIAPHINTTEVENTFPTAVINQTTGRITSHASQTMEANPARYLSKPIFQGFVEEVAHTLETLGVQNVSWPDISDLHEAMSENLDMTDYDIIQYSARSVKTLNGTTYQDWDFWGEGFIAEDGYKHTTDIEVCAIRFNSEYDYEPLTLEYANKYGVEEVNHFVGKVGNSPYSGGVTMINGKLRLTCDEHGFVNRTLYYTGSSGSTVYTLPVRHDNHYLRSTGISITWPTDDYIITDTTELVAGGSPAILFYTDPVSDEDQEVDAGWRDHIHVAGKAPVQGKTYKQRYADQNSHNVKVSQPDKNGNPKQTEYTRTSVRMGTDPVDQITNHGVNNPDDDQSYNQAQENAQSGKDTPRDNPISRFNDSVQDNINSYNDSKVSPETAPEEAPAGDPLPQYPNNPPTDTTGDSGDTPTPSTMTGVTASGMCSVYNPTKQELMNFSAWLWSPSFLDNFLKIFQNPMDAIIGLHIMYATPSTTTPENIVCGYLDSGVSAKVVNQQFTEIDCGTVTVPEYYGNAIDYEPYVQVHCYLPFVGIVSLKPNDIIGKKLNIKYGVDALTGTCLATLTTEKDGSEIACYTFAGNCATQIPISGGSYAQMITGLAGFIASGIGAVATGNPLMALGAGASLLNSHLDVGHSGAIGANAGAMGIRKPYLIITRKKAYDANGYNQFYGFPANKTVILGSCKGYTRVKSVHIESIPVATADEKQQIEVLLKQGVIIR